MSIVPNVPCFFQIFITLWEEMLLPSFTQNIVLHFQPPFCWKGEGSSKFGIQTVSISAKPRITSRKYEAPPICAELARKTRARPTWPVTWCCWVSYFHLSIRLCPQSSSKPGWAICDPRHDGIKLEPRGSGLAHCCGKSVNYGAHFRDCSTI